VYFDTSCHLSPLPPGPNLEPTWKHRWQRAQEDIEIADVDEACPNDLLGWLEFAELVRRYEPRIFYKYDFPHAHLTIIEQYLETLESKTYQTDAERSPKSSQEDLESTIRRLATLEKAVKRISSLWPSLKSLSGAVLAKITKNRGALERTKRERLADESVPDDESADISPSISIEEIFGDL
jgi:hypothetical protein